MQVLWRTDRPVAPRVCLFVHYDRDGILAPHVLYYLRALRACGFQICLISSNLDMGHADVPALRDVAGTLVLRENGGLDFGAWQDAIGAGFADGFRHVLLANDSVYGPLRPLAPILDPVFSSDIQAWGMVESQERGWHLQSWFLLLRNDIWRRREIQDVLALPFRGMSKDEIIKAGEIGLGRALQSAGAVCGAANRTVPPPVFPRARQPTNPMHFDWSRLVRTGAVPFIKVELLRDNPMGIPGTQHWPRLVEEAGYDPDLIATHLARVRPRDAVMREPSWRHLIAMLALCGRKRDVLDAIWRQLREYAA
jgi:lipopolysaccharide biosynthesis protein